MFHSELNKIKVPGTDYSFSAWLLEKADYLVIMDYRNFSLGRMGLSPTRLLLKKPCSKVVIAVDTAPSNADLDHITFYSFPKAAMEVEVVNRYKSYPLTG